MKEVRLVRFKREQEFRELYAFVGEDINELHRESTLWNSHGLMDYLYGEYLNERDIILFDIFGYDRGCIIRYNPRFMEGLDLDVDPDAADEWTPFEDLLVTDYLYVPEKWRILRDT